jgi:photoactive yellow protein
LIHPVVPAFHEAHLLDILDVLAHERMDELEFGLIGFDADARVRLYNRCESRFSGLAPERVLGHGLFTVIAPCLNNYLVAQRFDDAAKEGVELDATIDYVLTWRMEPTPVRLRMLSAPGAKLRYVLLQHQR